MLLRSLLVACGLAACALASPSRPGSIEVIAPVRVTDSLGRLVAGLPPEAFHVFEGQVEQRFSLLESDTPLSIGIILDSSSSMQGKSDGARRAVTDFFRALRPNSTNESFLIQFSERPSLMQSWTHDMNAIVNDLNAGEPHGKTALLDAVYLGLNEMRGASNPRRVLLVISDGHDTSSRYNGTEVAQRAIEAGVQIYGIGLFENMRQVRDENAELALLRSLAEPTGGRLFEGTPTDVPDLSARLAIELANQYLMKWTSANPSRDGKFRKIRVKLSSDAPQKSLRVSAPAGYYEPTQ